MAEYVLSQDEVESLLAGAEEAKGIKPAAAPKKEATVTAPAARPKEKIIPYDFKRPERVGKEQIRALQSLHEGFGRTFSAALSGLLRTMVDFKLTSVDQLTYSEFIFSLENPTCFNVLRADPLEGNLILDINPMILFPIIDRMLGGGRETGPAARRPLTEIEQRLVSRITNVFLAELRRAWENVLELTLEVVRIESNPQLVQIVPPNEVVVLISFELVLPDDVRGMLSLCIPFNSIERIGTKLSSNSWVTYGRRETNPETIEHITRGLREATVEMVVRLAESKITTGDLIGLRVGDVITTEQDIRQPLVVEVGGLPKFHGRAGAFKGKTAVRIEEPIPPPPAIKTA